MEVTATRRQRREPVELEIALIIIIILSGIYVAYDLLGEPRGGHPFGHWLGIIGTLLMLMTETLYSIRKRTRLLNGAGPVRWWLSFHIVTGIVGPFLVLMHTGLQFRGLAGVTMALTVLMVVSGFIGRYLYTALQRNRSTVLAQQRVIAAEIDMLQQQQVHLKAEQPTQLRLLAAELSPRYPESRFGRWRYRRRLRREFARVEREAADLTRAVTRLQRKHAALDRRLLTNEQTRRWFRLWHTAHVPLGLALFTSIALHIAAAIYFRAGIF